MNGNLENVNEAGVLLLRLVHSLRTDKGAGPSLKIDINDNTTSRILGRVRQILREVDIDTTQNCGLVHSEILQKYAAIQAALASFEET